MINSSSSNTRILTNWELEQGIWLLSLLKVKVVDNLLLDHVGLPYGLVLAVHLVNPVS